MPFKAQWYRDRLAKKRQKGFRGYPELPVLGASRPLERRVGRLISLGGFA